METEKRKIDSVSLQPEKKMKLELCPHQEKCYRRNPHHFKEYDHPHLEKYLQLDEASDKEFPASFTQDKQVYLEQIKVIRSLLMIAANKKEMKQTTNVVNDANLTQASTSNTNAKQRTQSSSKKIAKTTSFVANSNMTTPKSCNTMKEKFESTKPYNIFFTKVPKAQETLNKNNCVSFPDLICPSLGALKKSMQINFMIDVMWLNEQYEVHGLGDKPLTILYGYEFPSMEQYMNMKLKNVNYHLVKMKDPFGTHHSKMGIYLYDDDTLRIVISTANLYYEDWNHYNQGLWMSPPCPRMDESKHAYECSGPTGFKTTLLHYLNSYDLPILKEWIALVKRADFSDVKVSLVTSIPGRHYPKDSGSHVQMVGELLNKYCTLPAKTSPQSEGPLSWGLIAQASSIGSLGKQPSEWLRGVLLRSLATHKQSALTASSNASLSVIFPAANNVMGSLFGAEGGGCLPYSKAINEKQKWLKDYLYQWKAERTGRSRVMPHMKSYCRVSPCLTKLAWFLLTSANISKSAWGGNIQKNSACYVRSYEIGVMFLPHYFDETNFVISGETEKLFPFMYDLPLTGYGTSDEPWCN